MKLLILILFFIHYNSCFSQHIIEYDFLDKQFFPHGVRDNPDDINELGILYGDELIVNTKRELSFIKKSSPHHLFIFCNKLILRDTLIIDLRGGINIDYNDLKNFTPSKYEWDNAWYSFIPLDLQLKKSNYFDFVGNIDIFKSAYEKQKNEAYARDGILLFSIKELVFEDKGYLKLICPGPRFPLTVGYEKITFSSENAQIVKRKYINWRKNELKSFFNAAMKNNIKNEIEIENLGSLDIPNINWVKALLKTKGYIDEDILMAAVETEAERLITNQNIFAFRGGTAVNEGVFPWYVWTSKFADIFPNPEFMFIPGDQYYVSRRAIEKKEFFSEAYDNTANGSNDEVNVQNYYSKWVILYLKELIIKCQEYELNNNTERLFDIINKVLSIKFTVSSDFKSEYIRLTQQLSQIKQRLILPLTVKRLSKPLMPDVYLLRENNSQTVFALPTDILITPVSVNGQSKLGYMEVEPANPDKLTLYFTGKMSVNPFVEQAIKQEGLEATQVYAGMFKSCSWQADSPLPIEGLDYSLSYVRLVGDQLEGKLVFNSRAGSNLSLVRLGTGIGVDLPLTWTYKNDSRFSGKIDLRLSFGKQDQSLIQLTNNNIEVQNTAIYPVTITYYHNQQDKVVALIPGLKLQPGKTALLPDGAIAKRIPPEACEYELSVINLPSFFQQLANYGFAQTIRLDNDLPERREGNGYLKWVELEIHYKIGDNAVLLRKQVPPKQEILLQVFNPSESDLQIEISGRAIYEQGYQDLKKTIFNASLIQLSKISVEN